MGNGLQIANGFPGRLKHPQPSLQHPRDSVLRSQHVLKASLQTGGAAGGLGGDGGYGGDGGKEGNGGGGGETGGGGSTQMSQP